MQREKDIVRRFLAAIDQAETEGVAEVCADYMAQDCLWRGFHPFGELTGPADVAAQFWKPLKRSMTGLQHRQDIFFAGVDALHGDGSRWVVSMGHLMGLFDHPWLGIAPSGRMAFLRYCTFCKVEGERIVDIAMFFDIPHLMVQAGLRPFSESAGAYLVQPGPKGHGGLLFDAQPAEDGAATLAAINAMIEDLGQWQLGLPLEEELARTWHDDMIWWGPEGIGATYTIERYAKQHSGPFRAAFSDRSGTGHVARLAEGHFGGFFGWPNFTARMTGAYLGRAATGQMGEFRVIDIYRREGDKLAENWVFIDLLHFWACQGVDILAESLRRQA